MTPNAEITALAHGEVGISSEAMAMWLAFDTVPRELHCYPHDPDDLDRCLKLLDAAPWLRDKLPKMARLGHEWAALRRSSLVLAAVCEKCPEIGADEVYEEVSRAIEEAAFGKKES